MGFSGRDALDAELIVENALNGNLEVIWVFGHDLVELFGEDKIRKLSQSVPLFIFSGTNDNSTVPWAHWVLPSAAYVEKDGTFVSETIVAPKTLAQGSTWDIDFSHDPEQTYLYLADGQNMKVYIIERETMEVLTAFGDGGRQPGMFFAVHSIAVDSDGNIYTTETYEGSRVQKFVFKGIGPVPAGAEGEKSQGVLWPTN